MPNIDYFQPVKIFGYFLFIIGAIGLISHILLIYDARYTFEFRAFLLSLSILHVLIGVGVIFKKIWGFYFLKGYLVLLYIAFPIGTYIAFKSLKYINKYNIAEYFRT